MFFDRRNLKYNGDKGLAAANGDGKAFFDIINFERDYADLLALSEPLPHTQHQGMPTPSEMSANRAVMRQYRYNTIEEVLEAPGLSQQERGNAMIAIYLNQRYAERSTPTEPEPEPVPPPVPPPPLSQQYAVASPPCPLVPSALEHPPHWAVSPL